MARIYLDYNATTPLRTEVIDGMMDALRETGNASSVHGCGRGARNHIESAREDVAKIAQVNPAQVIFNSGATEGNNTILSGFTDKPVFVGGCEHPAVLKVLDHAQKIPVLKNGVVDLDALSNMIKKTPPTLIAVQLVNSETGVIQPISEISALAKSCGAQMLCDGVQATGRIEIDFKMLGVDYLTLSAHKFGGPQGAGALLFREGLLLPKLLRGGGQEKRQRAGTENVAAIHGFGIAARITLPEISAYQIRVSNLRQTLEHGLKSIAPDIIVAGEAAPRVANTCAAILPRVAAETQLMAMDLAGVAVSSGSACSSGAFVSSHVLTAMGYDDDAAKSNLRFSLGWATTSADIEFALTAFENMVKRVRK